MLSWIDRGGSNSYCYATMSSYAAKVALICAFAVVWINAQGHVRAYLIGDPCESAFSESDDSKQSYETQHLLFVAPSLCLSMAPAPEFAALAIASHLGIDAAVNVAVPKRGPPTIGFGCC